MFKKLITILSTLVLAGCSSGALQYGALSTVQSVDIKQYAGKWHEIARLDQRFQRGCVATTAEYSIRDDGDVRVINTCTKNGKIKQASGRAWVVDETSNAKLKVQFPLNSIKLPFLSGDYWIIALDEDYQYAMVGEESRGSLWILGRDAQMPADTLSMLVDKARNAGFPVDELIYDNNEITTASLRSGL